MLDGFDFPGDFGGSGGSYDSSGCFWSLIWFSTALLLFIGFLWWMS